jgi:hypothetical protein
MAPLRQYFSRLLKESKSSKAGESIAAPKGRRINGPQAFFPVKGPLPEATTGTTMPIADTSGRHPSAASAAVVVGEGHAPVVPVLLASAKARRVHRCPQKGANRGPPAFLPAK